MFRVAGGACGGCVCCGGHSARARAYSPTVHWLVVHSLAAHSLIVRLPTAQRFPHVVPRWQVPRELLESAQCVREPLPYQYAISWPAAYRKVWARARGFFATVGIMNLSTTHSPESAQPTQSDQGEQRALRFALCQMQAQPDVAANLRRIVGLIEEASGEGADVVVFPEAAMFPFGAGRLDNIAEPLDGKFVQTVQAAARQHQVMVVAGMFTPADTAERNGKVMQRVNNTLLVVDGQGNAPVVYHKVHTYNAFGYRESDTVKPGEEFVVVSCNGVQIGLATCYDVRFPRQFVELARRGAHVVVVPTSWADGEGKLEQWRVLTAARALDATVWVVAPGMARPGGDARAGEADGPTGIGHSTVVSPEGVRVAEAGYGEEMLVVKVDVAAVVRARRALPVLEAHDLGL